MNVAENTNPGVLANAKHEHFAQLIAGGETPTKAYILAGYSEKGAHSAGARLFQRPEICARIAHLQAAVKERALEKAAVDKAWVLTRLRENVERSMQIVPVRDRKGKETGWFKYEGMTANRALELLGKELGMFHDSIDHTMKWDGDPKKLTKEQLETLTKAIEEQTFGGDEEAAAAAREAAVREMRKDTVQ